ncbi:uncharacterized protein SPPG_01558 [Spizellomyces punctatus DAOM BR117]|uniref:G-protein coupled receptors family 2 profile 2 domain-containing protein n=1 Tax=Spizellomyces punctatus (strain DAOM BR117) TaxID=645134 RepID=A0A0L0HTC9_SPIPD|nr:uncharacterized protein SPPG_01558 [Spizellomyces punctatus DAOM BR117]KND04119.1 hypothetical protein SPPG_01558 [Spizellomyces punctatus DAOM BR117]|eukprot:XP_016612158.1 hypothetical protein SPPG_01558 [Spizellomyces punctatus DAOM BR117]
MRAFLPFVLVCLTFGTVHGQANNDTQTTAQPCAVPLVPIPPSFTPSFMSACHPTLRCCLPCPATDYLYPPNVIIDNQRTMGILRIISGTAAFLVSVSYLVLPGKREHPRVFVLYISFLLAIWHWIGMSYFFGDKGHNVFCAKDGVTRATLDNNAFCAIQGLTMIWASIALTCWGLVVVLNLHLQLVWSNAVLERLKWAPHLFSWAIPTIVAACAIISPAVQYGGGGLCFVQTYKGRWIFFVPTGILCTSIFLIHTATTVWLCRKARCCGRRKRKPLLKEIEGGLGSIPRDAANSTLLDLDRNLTGIPSTPPKAAILKRTSRATFTGVSKSSDSLLQSVGSLTRKVSVKLSGVGTVQIRLIGVGMIVVVIATVYGLSCSLDKTQISGFFKAKNAEQTPAEDLVACMQTALTQQPPLSSSQVFDICKALIKLKRGVVFPSPERWIATEVILSLPGLCLLVMLANSLGRDWRNWWSTKRDAGGGTRGDKDALELRPYKWERSPSPTSTRSTKGLLPQSVSPPLAKSQLSTSFPTQYSESLSDLSSSESTSLPHITIPAAAKTPATPNTFTSLVPETPSTAIGESTSQGTFSTSSVGTPVLVPSSSSIPVAPGFERVAHEPTISHPSEQEVYGPTFSPW